MWRSWVLWVYCAAIVGWMGAGRGSWGAGPLNISDQGVNSEREQTFGKMRQNEEKSKCWHEIDSPSNHDNPDSHD